MEHVTAFVGYTATGTVIGTVQPTRILGENIAYIVDGEDTVWVPFRTGRFSTEHDALVALLGIECVGAKVPGMRYDAATVAESKE